MQQKRVVTSRSAPFLKPTRMRMSPTFYHHDIFTDRTHCDSSRVRFTPTFASTALENQEEKEVNPPRPVPSPLCQPTSVSFYHNESKRRTMVEFNPCCEFAQEPVGRRVDAKQQLMEDIREYRGTSRMRKVVDLMSNPIFGGYTWHLTPYDPKKYSPRHQRAQKHSPDHQEPAQKEEKEEAPQEAERENAAQNPQSSPKKEAKSKKQVKASGKAGGGKTTGGKGAVGQRQAKNIARLKSADALRHK